MNAILRLIKRLTAEVPSPRRQPASPTFTIVVAFLLLAFSGLAQIPQDAAGEFTNRRDAAIAAFTKHQQEANYPALFEKAAQEFRVPVNILEGIAFAETRWEHLTWPEGETASPDTGMPRPYGIMSLWDNQYFGHSLMDAAALLGETPEILKRDPYSNIRGAAALLRQIYDMNQRPEGTVESDIASWRNAIAVYSGLPQPELNQQHALDIYEHISKGYHQYGIEWNGQPVNLEPIRAAVRQIQEREKLNSQFGAKPPPSTPSGEAQASSTPESPQEVTPKPGVSIVSSSVDHPTKRNPFPFVAVTYDYFSERSIWLGILALALAGLLGWLLQKRILRRKT